MKSTSLTPWRKRNESEKSEDETFHFYQNCYLVAINEANPFEDLLEYGSDFEFGTDDPNCMTVEFRIKGNDVIPAISMSLTKTGVLSKKALTKTKYFGYLQDYVCSCAIRVARELFSIIPIDTVNSLR